VAANLKKK